MQGMLSSYTWHKVPGQGASIASAREQLPAVAENEIAVLGSKPADLSVVSACWSMLVIQI